MKQTEIIFVYNANSSIFSQVTDYVHKIVAPQTYECNLCKLTYDNLGMKKEWKQFIESIPHKVIFLHKNELQKQYPNLLIIPLPAVFKQQNGQLTQLITAKEINLQKTIPELEKLIKSKLQ